MHSDLSFIAQKRRKGRKEKREVRRRVNLRTRNLVSFLVIRMYLGEISKLEVTFVFNTFNPQIDFWSLLGKNRSSFRKRSFEISHEERKTAFLKEIVICSLQLHQKLSRRMASDEVCGQTFFFKLFALLQSDQNTPFGHLWSYM